MPKPFLNKLIVHGAIGFFCVLFGCIYGFVTDDQIFLLMSLCIGVGTVIRIVSLLHTIKMHDYTELTGTCTKREVSPLTKKQKIIFRSTDQKEYHFTFDKNIRILSGHYYRLYFRNVANLSGEEKVTPDLLAYQNRSSYAIFTYPLLFWIYSVFIFTLSEIFCLQIIIILFNCFNTLY